MSVTGAARPPLVGVDTPTSVGPYCDNCGRDSDPYAPPGALLVCGRCRRWHAVIAVVHRVLAFAAVAVIVWYAMPRLIADHTPFQPDPQPGADYLAFYAALIVGVCVHEGAHALCAIALGFSVPSVRVGSGPVLFRSRIRQTALTVRLVPFSGVTAWRPGTAEVTTAQRALVAACGPAVNLVLAAVAWSLRAQDPRLTIPFACGNLLLFVQNIIPRPPANANDTPNDGWQILKNLTRSHWALSHLRRLELSARCGALTAAHDRGGAIAYLRSEIARRGGDDPDAEAMLCQLLLDGNGDPEAISEGFERSSRLLRDRRAAPRARAAALERRASMLAAGGWPHLMAEAEWTAREALHFLPGNLNATGTLALVRLRLGHADEAEQLLDKVIAGLQQANAAAVPAWRRSLATHRCARGLVYAQTDRFDAAARELADARALDSACPLLAELEQAVQPRQPLSPPC